MATYVLNNFPAIWHVTEVGISTYVYGAVNLTSRVAGLPPGENVTDLPPQPYRQPTFSFTSLFRAPVALPPGENVTAGPVLPVQPIPPWYYQNLLTGTLAPPPVITYIARAPTYANARGWDYHVQLRQWFGAIPPAGALPVGAMPGEPVAGVPQAPPRPLSLQSWTWNYNLNLIGKDKLPTGVEPGNAVTGLPGAPPWPLSLQSWTWSYNRNLLGKDRFPPGIEPGNIVYELTPRSSVGSPAQTWIWNYNLNLIGKDKFPPGVEPGNALYDLTPRAYDYSVQLRSWVSFLNLSLVTTPLAFIRFPGKIYTDLPAPAPRADLGFTRSFPLSLIGQDQLPAGEQVIELPPRPPLAASDLRTWINLVNLALTTPRLPFNQYDWQNPKAPQQQALSWTAFYNLDLIGQDRLPFRQSDWPLPGTPADGRTWIQAVNLALTTAAPTRIISSIVTDLPAQPSRGDLGFTRSFNLNLIGQDRLPFRQTDWPLTPTQGRSADLATWIDRVKFQLFAPFAQLDWPLPIAARQPALSWTSSFPLTLIGQDQLPNRQQDWSISSAHIPAPLQVMIAGTQIILIPPAVIPPGVAHGGIYTSRPDLRVGTAADLYNLAVSPQVPPTVVSGQVPFRTLVGTGI